MPKCLKNLSPHSYSQCANGIQLHKLKNNTAYVDFGVIHFSRKLENDKKVRISFFIFEKKKKKKSIRIDFPIKKINDPD